MVRIKRVNTRRAPVSMPTEPGQSSERPPLAGGSVYYSHPGTEGEQGIV